MDKRQLLPGFVGDMLLISLPQFKSCTAEESAQQLSRTNRILITTGAWHFIVELMWSTFCKMWIMRNTSTTVASQKGHKWSERNRNQFLLPGQCWHFPSALPEWSGGHSHGRNCSYGCWTPGFGALVGNTSWDCLGGTPCISFWRVLIIMWKGADVCTSPAFWKLDINLTNHRHEPAIKNNLYRDPMTRMVMVNDHPAFRRWGRKAPSSENMTVDSYKTDISSHQRKRSGSPQKKTGCENLYYDSPKNQPGYHKQSQTQTSLFWRVLHDSYTK